MTLRAAVYLRISKDRAGDGLGIDRQLEDCRALAKLRHWEIDEKWVLRENDTSATSGPRPKFEQLMRGMERGAFDVVVAYKVDRLVRRMRDMADLYDTAQRHGILLATSNGDLDLSTDGGRAQALLLGALSEIEIGNLKDRLKRTARQSVAAGRNANGGSRPFGWNPSRNQQVPEEAAVIREVAGRILDGESVTSVCRDLNRRQILTPGKRAKDADGRYIDGQSVAQGKWTTPRLRSMLSSPRHAGVVMHKGEPVVDEHGEPVQAAWEPILDLESWEQLKRALAARSFTSQGWSNRRSHLLTGLARCGVCGDPLGLARGRNGVWSYRCRTHVSRARDLLDQHVLREVIAYAKDHPIRVGDVQSEDHDKLRRLVQEKEKQLRDLEDNFVTTGGSAAVLARTTARIEAEIEQLRARQLDELGFLTDMQWAEFDMSSLLATSASLLPKDEGADGTKVNAIEQQRAAIKMYSSRIEVFPTPRGRGFNPDGVRITWSDPNRLFWRGIVEKQPDQQRR